MYEYSVKHTPETNRRMASFIYSIRFKIDEMITVSGFRLAPPPTASIRNHVRATALFAYGTCRGSGMWTF